MFPDKLWCSQHLGWICGYAWAFHLPSISRCEENHNYEPSLCYQKHKAVGKRAKEVQNDSEPSRCREGPITANLSLYLPWSLWGLR